MSRDTDKDWQEVARTDPYWGVISTEDFRIENISEDRLDEFYTSGDAVVDGMLNQIRKHFDKDFVPQRALDFGCGVGRLLLPLAKRCREEAIGLDIAPDMLARCEEAIARYGVENCHPRLSDDMLSQADGQFDLVNTLIVLQHIPEERGYQLIRQLLEKTAEGGYCSLQLTYAKSKVFWPHEQGRSRYYRDTENGIQELGRIADAREAGAITMYDYDLNEVFAACSEYSSRPMLCKSTLDDNHLGVHVILCRETGS